MNSLRLLRCQELKAQPKLKGVDVDLNKDLQGSCLEAPIGVRGFKSQGESCLVLGSGALPPLTLLTIYALGSEGYGGGSFWVCRVCWGS